MSAKAIRECDGKRLLSVQWQQQLTNLIQNESIPVNLFLSKSVSVDSQTSLDLFVDQHPWLQTARLVVKPDQLIKRRGKSGLLLLNATWDEVKLWIQKHARQSIQIEGVEGQLNNFIVEPFVPHSDQDECYVCIQADRYEDTLLFCRKGGVDVGDVDRLAEKLSIETDTKPSLDLIVKLLQRSALPNDPLVPFHQGIAQVLFALYSTFVDCHFTYLEINPLVIRIDDNVAYVHCLDLAAKLDQTAEYECASKWMPTSGGNDLPSPMPFPAPFGRELTAEEAYIAELDGKTGASLKLTILNRRGRVWCMVAGGGASVVYTDAIVALGFAGELANYGEYSGAPTETQTFEYAKTLLTLMTRDEPHPEGKILFIGGGIANFTNVASTFAGIIRALTEFRHELIHHKVRIYVRRAGPNYQDGLRAMRELGDTLGVPIQVFGPATHMTAIVPLALTPEAPLNAAILAMEKQQIASSDSSSSLTGILHHTESAPNLSSNLKTSFAIESRPASPALSAPAPNDITGNTSDSLPSYRLFDRNTRALVYGLQTKAVQGMLDFDFMCKRSRASVAAMIYPFSGAHVQKFYWGTQELVIPVYPSVAEAVQRHADASVIVSFASCRSVYATTLEMLEHPSIKTIALIAEGVPERRTRQLIRRAKQCGVTLIGPATVGGLQAGAFKIGNTGGFVDNLIASKLYRDGSVAYVSKSGGMSNELNNIISRSSDGVYEGIAIGGDRYPITTFLDHLLRFEADPACRMLLLLGEVGGVAEYEVCDAVRQGLITKPVIAWCIGTSASAFSTEVQFGHAGALAGSQRETASAKNQALREAGVFVPSSFEELPALLAKVYQEQVTLGKIRPRPEPEVPRVPVDYGWAQELGLVRKQANIVSTICDDRGQELLYSGMPISRVFEEQLGIGGVVSLLWFKRRLPPFACEFIESVLMITADHGPAVSGAHNTIVTARAGKDLVSSLASGLLTIGERFGGALDGAAEQFSSAYDQGLSPQNFVDSMRRAHKLILGIGHKIKSRTNPDLRVKILVDFARAHFPQMPLLDYALKVEQITTSKKDNLILNVDGAVGVLFVDLLRHCGAFTAEEADEYVKIGALNGLFVLGRSIGFIGHFLDQKRLKQGLYRHPWDDISYLP